MPDHYPVTLDYFVRRQTWPGWNIPLRRIRNYELVYVLDGEGNITLRGKPLHLIPGDLILFRPGEAHSLTVTQAPCMVFYGIHFSPLQETPMLSLPDRMHISSPLRLEVLFRQLQEAYAARDGLAAWRRNLLMEQILLDCIPWQIRLSTPQRPPGSVGS